MLFIVKYALINFRSPNQYTISIDLLSIRIRCEFQSAMYALGGLCVLYIGFRHFGLDSAHIVALKHILSPATIYADNDAFFPGKWGDNMCFKL